MATGLLLILVGLAILFRAVRGELPRRLLAGVERGPGFEAPDAGGGGRSELDPSDDDPLPGPLFPLPIPREEPGDLVPSGRRADLHGGGR